MKVLVDYIGGKHPLSKAAERARAKAENDALFEQIRLRKVHKDWIVQLSLLAFVESPWVPTKVESCRWPFPRFTVGQIRGAGGIGFFLVRGEGDTAKDAVDDALKKHPKPYL